MKRVIIILLALAVFLAALPLAGAESVDSPYVENAWNFVDGSMDATQGIPEDAEGVLAGIRENGVLRVATEPYFAPQEFIDPGLEGQESYVGADMDLARLIAERMGVELEIVPMEFSQVLAAVAEGRCDLAISGLSYTPGRAAYVTLSKGYYFAGEGEGTGILIREQDADAIRSVDDLKGRNIVAQTGSLQESMAAEHVMNYREFRRLSSMYDIYAAVERRRADAAVVDIHAARLYMESEPNCGLMLVEGVHFVQDEAYEGDRIAARKGELQLMYFVNGVIDELLASGEYDRWIEEYGDYAARLGV